MEPNQNNVAGASVMQQWLWGYFNAISAMLLVTYGVGACLASCTAPLQASLAFMSPAACLLWTPQ